MSRRGAGNKEKKSKRSQNSEVVSASASARNEKTKGRVVWNHSTHLPGLIPVLERLAQYSGIETITPAVIGSTRSNSAELKIKVSIPILGGYKLIARKGKTFQEVFVITPLGQDDLEGAIAQALRK